MKSERWKKIEEIYHRARERDGYARQAILDDACWADEELRRQVESLLKADADAESFLDTPAMNVAAQMIAGEPTASLVGKRISRYEIVELIGAGGMGEVYRAKDIRLDRQVAIKVLPPNLSRDTDAVARFEREAKAVAALSHPNILAIHDFGTDLQVCYAVTELLEGETLRARLLRTPLGWSEAVEIAVGVAEGLSAAHAKGVVHRDLKPENLLITTDGRIKILDFGLAKLKPSKSDQVNTIASTELVTEPGVVMGTVGYMSPEQVRGDKVDAPSDLFSLGCIIYEMLTGRRAFAGETAAETMAAILRDEPPKLSEAVKNVPSELERILAKCLEKSPEWRYQSARDLWIDLRHLKRESGSNEMQVEKVDGESARRTSIKRNRASLFTTITVIAALAVGITAGVWVISSRNKSSVSLAPLKILPLTSYQGAEWFPSFSPDGNQVAFSWGGEKQDNFDIYTRSVEHGVPFRLTHDPAEDHSPAWSPDNRFIAFLRFLPDGKAGVFLTAPLSRAERLLAEVAAPARQGGFFGPHLAWSPDSKWIVTADKKSPELPFGLVLISVETGERRLLTSPQKGEHDIAPAVSADGRSLAFIRSLGFFVSELYLLELTEDLRPKGEPAQLTDEGQRTTSPVWSQDGREIIFASGNIGSSRLYRLEAAEPGKPREIESVGEIGPPLAISHAAHRLAYTRSALDLNIWRLQIGIDGRPVGGPVSFISSTREEATPQVSPDGRKVAFNSNRSGYMEIWVSDSDGSNAVRLTSFSGPEAAHPRWSPGGERLIFQAHPKGNLDIYLINVNGGAPERLTHEQGDDNVPSWSRDGHWIYFHSFRSGASQVWKMRTDGSDAIQVTKQGGFAAVESKDGVFLYYSKRTPHGYALWRVPVGGGEEVEIVKGIQHWSTFAPVAQGIYFIPRRELTTNASIQFLSFADGQTKNITELAKPVMLGFTISPDGQTLLYTQVDQQGHDLMLVENFR